MFIFKNINGRGVVAASVLFCCLAVTAAAQTPDPAPAAAEEAKPNEGAEFIANYDPSKSYSRLLFPNVASMVGLTPKQQEEVSRLMTERSAALAAATDQNEWPKIVEKSEAEIKAVLKPEQVKKFEQTINDRLITIRFSKTRWADVLKWFSAELGLQLIMNSPPPGTFNYNDKNRYTPREALDILNGRLQFQGYTLIHTGNMLYVHNFKDGPIPLQFLPKITLEELPQQSRFSYVALKLPLQYRSLASVLAAIKPFQGPYNSTQPLIGNTLLIIDSVNALREIVPVALAITNPPVAPVTPVAAPVWKTYPLEKATPTLIKEQIEKFVPSARPLYNPSANQISYLAIPAAQAIIEGLIQRLEEGADPAKELTSAVYPLSEITNMSEETIRAAARRFDMSPEYLLGSQALLEIGQEIADSLKVLCPEATIVLNDVTKQLVVVARPEDQEKIKKTVEEIKTSFDSPEDYSFGVYALGNSKVMTPAEVGAFQQMVPMAQVSYDRRKNSILVFGSKRDVACVAAAAETLKNHYETLTDERTFVSFAMTAKQLEHFNAVFEKIQTTSEMEGVAKVDDGRANRVEFWGTRRQLETLRSIAEQITGTKFPPIESAAPETEQESAPKTESGEPAEAPAEGSEAAPAESVKFQDLDSENFQTASEESDPSQPETGLEMKDGTVMKILRVRNADKETVVDLLMNTIPGIEIDKIPDSDSFVFYGSREDLKTASRILSELESTDKNTIKTVPYTNTFPASAFISLSASEPNVKVTRDPIRKQFILFGPAENVEQLAELLNELMTATPEEIESVRYVGVEREIPAELISHVRRVFPNLTVTYSAAAKRFTLIGNPDDQDGAAKMITNAESSLPAEEETRWYPMESPVSDELLTKMREALPEASDIKRNGDNPKLLTVKARPEIQEKVLTELARLQKETPETEKKVFASYTLEKPLRKTFDDLLPDFIKENGEIRILGYEDETMGVWALPFQQEKLSELISNLRSEGKPEESKTTAKFYDIQYSDAATLIPLVKEVVPDAGVAPDPSGNRISVRGTGKAVNDALEFLATIDLKPAQTGTERFLRVLPRRLAPQTLSTLIQAAFPRLTPTVDTTTGYLLINTNRVPKEDLLEFVDLVDPESPSPLEPTLKVYTFQKTPTQTMADTLQNLAPNARIILQADKRQMMVIAKPAELDVIDKNVEAIEGAAAPAEPFVKFYAFDREPTDETVSSLIDSLKRIAPEAVAEVNKKTRQLMVIAKPADQEKVEENLKSIVETFNPVDLKMVAYPISGMDADTLKTTLAEIYPDIKIETDTVGRRLLIWATLDQHVRISEEIAAVNAKGDTESADYDGPKCAVYTAQNGGEARMLQRLIRTMFPAAEVYTESLDPNEVRPDYYQDEMTYWTDRIAGEQKVTVLATSREQELIASLFAQHRNPANAAEMRMETWLIGNMDPEGVEVMIQNLLPHAVSLSPPQVKSARHAPQPKNDNAPFFRVDPRTKTAAVYAEEGDLEKVKGVLDQMNDADGASEMRSSVHTLVSPIAPQLVVELKKLVPSAQLTATDYYQIIAFATEADLQTIDRFLADLTNLETSDTHHIMKSVFLPEGCMASRDMVVQYLTSQFIRERGYAYNAANANQIILWGTQRVVDEMTKFIEETCKTTEEEIYRSYPVDHIDPATAVALLTRIAPNATLTPDVANKKVTVLGSAFIQERVKSALAEIDAKRTGDAALTAKYYNMEGFSAALFYPVYTALVRQFPQAVIVADPTYLQFTIVDTEEAQGRIAEFFESMKKKQLETTPVFQVYTLKHANYKTLFFVLKSAVSTAMLFPGKVPGEFYAFAKPESQDKIRRIVAKIDTIQDGETNGITPKVYRVDAKHTASAVAQLAPTIPNAQLYPLTGGGVLMWGSASDHEAAEKYFGTFAEAYPEPVLRRYTLKHIKYTDASAFLTRAFASDAIFYPASTGELLADAAENVQAKIADALAQIDVPQDESVEPTAAAYDVSELPAASQKTAVGSVLRICPEAIFMPTATEGYFVIYAKPKDQAKIASLIGKMVADSPNRAARMEKYSLRNISYADAVKLIAEIAPNAKPSPGKDTNQIYVWAKNSDHVKIADAIGKLNEEVKDGTISRVYHLTRANLTQAQTSIRSLFPTQVQSIIDPASRTITVHGAPIWQEKIAELIAEIDRTDAETQTSIQVFNITGIASAPVLAHLKSFYLNDPDFRVNYDVSNQSLVVQGSAEQIETARSLIEQIRQGGLSDSDQTVKTYTLRNSMSYYTLRSVFQHQGRTVDMQLDYATGKLIVFGRPEEHQTIERILAALAPEPTNLAVYDLQELDPETAANIISTMLESDGTFVDVQPDNSSGKLYIRATAQKQEEIRQFLIEAGETSLQAKPEPKAETDPSQNVSIRGDGSIRTVVSDGDISRAVRDVQQNWNRENQVRVVNGSSSQKLIQTRENPEGSEVPTEETPAEPNQDENNSEKPASPISALLRGMVTLAASVQTAGASEKTEAPAVYAVINPDGTATITSADTEALDEFQKELTLALRRQNAKQTESGERVDFFDVPADEVEENEKADGNEKTTKNIRALARQNRNAAEEKLVMEDRDYSVYKVENVSVDQMIARLNVYMADKLNPKPAARTLSAQNRGVTVTPISSGQRLTFEADKVMNTILVKGKKSDRDEAGAMIAVLDKTELFPQPITKPVKIQVRNTSVTKMAQQVLNVFQLKFMTTKLPGGLTPRILPNTDANVLEIFAPKELAEEISEYVRETDAEILEDKTSQVKIVPLEEMNARVFQKYIDNLKGPQSNYILVSPYTINPQYTRQPRQF